MTRDARSTTLISLANCPDRWRAPPTAASSTTPTSRAPGKEPLSCSQINASESAASILPEHVSCLTHRDHGSQTSLSWWICLKPPLSKRASTAGQSPAPAIGRLPRSRTPTMAPSPVIGHRPTKKSPRGLAAKKKKKTPRKIANHILSRSRNNKAPHHCVSGPLRTPVRT